MTQSDQTLPQPTTGETPERVPPEPSHYDTIREGEDGPLIIREVDLDVYYLEE